MRNRSETRRKENKSGDEGKAKSVASLCSSSQSRALRKTTCPVCSRADSQGCCWRRSEWAGWRAAGCFCWLAAAAESGWSGLGWAGSAFACCAASLCPLPRCCCCEARETMENLRSRGWREQQQRRRAQMKGACDSLACAPPCSRPKSGPKTPPPAASGCPTLFATRIGLEPPQCPAASAGQSSWLLFCRAFAGVQSDGRGKHGTKRRIEG